MDRAIELIRLYEKVLGRELTDKEASIARDFYMFGKEDKGETS